MMVALGLGARVGAAMFHLFAHAFFKALLFLGCGSVIHATDNQEMSTSSAGLEEDADHRARRSSSAALAMAGVVPSRGLLGKDEILVAALRREHRSRWCSSLLASLPITAIYMTRLVMLHVHRRAEGPARLRARARIAGRS